MLTGGKEREMHIIRTTVSEFAEEAKMRNFPPQARIRVIVEDERSPLSHAMPTVPAVRRDERLLDAIRRPSLLPSRRDVVDTLRDIRDRADS
jgi:hypothetical protein